MAMITLTTPRGIIETPIPDDRIGCCDHGVLLFDDCGQCEAES